MSKILKGLTFEEGTLLRVSYSVLIGVLGTLIGFVFWLTSLYSLSQANADGLAETQSEVTEVREALRRIDKRLCSIQAFLEKRIPNCD